MKKAVVIILLSLAFLKSASSSVLAETVIWNPDPLPINKKSGETITLSFTVSAAYYNTRYVLVPGGASGWEEGRHDHQTECTTGEAETVCSTPNLTYLFENPEIYVFKIKRINNPPGEVMTIDSRSMVVAPNPDRPDLIISPASICYKPNPNDSTLADLYWHWTEKNIGGQTAGAHSTKMMIKVDPRGVCNGPSFDYYESTVNVGPLAPNQTYFSQGWLPSNRLKLDCVKRTGGSAPGTRIYADSGGAIVENEERNNDFVTYEYSQCAALPTPTPTSVVSAIKRVNAGGPSYTDANSKVWFADTGYLGGQTYITNHNISGTSDQTLYKSERYNMSEYRLSTSKGVHQVTLKFAEIYPNCQWAGCRVFDVSLEGKEALINFDIYREAGGGYKALDKTFTVDVSDGILNISFKSVRQAPKISAIEIK